MPALGNRGPEPGRRIPAPRRAPTPPPRHEHPPPAWKGPAGVTGTTSAPGRPAPRPKPKPSPVGVRGTAKAGERVVPIHSQRDLMAALSQRQGVHGGVTAERATPGLLQDLGHLASGAIGKTYGQGRPGAIVAQPVPRDFATNASKDVLALGTLPFLGGYKLAEALVERAKGNPQPAEKLAKGTLQSLEHGALGELAQGHVAGAERAFQAHPGFTVAELGGLGGIAGRTSGAAARAAGLGRGDSTFARAVSGVRSPIAISKEAALAERYHQSRVGSKDLIRGLIQQATDRALRTPVRDAEGKVVHATSHGKRVPVLQAREGRIFNEGERLAGRVGNYYSASHSAVQRRAREAAPRILKGEIKREGAKLKRVGAAPKVKGRAAEIAAHLAAEGVIASAHSFDHDVRNLRATVREHLAHPEQHYADRGELKDAQHFEKELTQLLEDPRLNSQKERIVARGEHIAVKGLNSGDVALAAHDVMPVHRLERARLGPAALAHVEGARHGEVVTSDAIAEHAALRKAARAAHGEVKAAERQLRVAEDARSRLVGARGARSRDAARAQRTGEPTKLELAKQRIAKAAARLDAAKKHAAEAADRVPSKPKAREGIVDENGAYIPNERIEAALKAKGRNPATVAYLPHRREETLKGSFYKHLRLNRPAGPLHERTYSLHQRGVVTRGDRVLADELANKATTISKVESFDAIAHDVGLRSPHYDAVRAKAQRGERLTRDERKELRHEGHMTQKQADELKAKLEAEGKGEWATFRTHASRLDEQAADRVRASQDTKAMETAHLGLLQSRLVDDHTGARNVVLVDKRLVKQLEAHAEPVKGFTRVGRLLNAPFRYAVLPQFKWLAGNFIEPYLIRLPLSGSGLLNMPGMALDVRAAKGALKAMERSGDPAVKRSAKVYRSMLEEGLFIGGRQASIRTRGTEFEGAIGRSVRGVEQLYHALPATKQLTDLGLALPRSFFWINRKLIESPAEFVAFGKSVRRDMQRFTGSWMKTVKLSQQVLDEMSKGLANTATMHRFLREQHELLGQYDGFGPGTRRLIQGWTPFLPWTLASLRFVYWTVPAHHTVAFVGLTHAANSVLKEWEAEHKDTPPGDLRFAPKTKGGGYVDLARNTPYGVSIPLTEEDPRRGLPKALLETVLPQFKSPAAALLFGKDNFGRDLQVPGGGKPTGGQVAGIALNDLAEAFVPLLSEARRLREGGGTGYSNSTVITPHTKPGTSHGSAIDRTLNPFHPTYLQGSRRPSRKQRPHHSTVLEEYGLGPGEAAPEASQSAADAQRVLEEYGVR